MYSVYSTIMNTHTHTYPTVGKVEHSEVRKLVQYSKEVEQIDRVKLVVCV